MVMNELESGPEAPFSLITSEDLKTRYKELLGVVRQEYEEIAKNEVQRAISADEEAIGAAVQQLHRPRESLHPARARAQQVHRRDGRSPMSASCAASRKRSTSAKAAKTTSASRDHELHRRAGP
jgi:hypothetical protein